MSKTSAVDEVRELLAAFNAALATRDASVVQHFHPQAMFLGSEPGEEARGRAALEALFATILASPNTVQFAWQRIDAEQSGDVAWFLAEGEVTIAGPGGTRRRPYRLTGVLDVDGERAVWRQFHGSEPWVEPAVKPE